MSSKLYDQVMEDLKAFMKAGEKEKVLCLRGFTAAVKDATVNAAKEMTDDAVIAVVAKAIKQREESIEEYRKANRPELAAQEQSEIDILKKYQPAQLSEAEVAALVKEAVAATGATTKKEMGKVMGALMPKVKGKADGKLVSRLVSAVLK